MSRVVLSGVSVVFAEGTPWERVGLHRIDLCLEPGDRALVVGGNGAGKSTLGEVLCGTIRPTAGTATIDGEPLDRATARIAVVIQHTRLQLMSATVGDELRAVTDTPERIPAVAGEVGVLSLLDRRIDELSGGQQRRVGMAAALLRNADLLVLDEPMAGLDENAAAGVVRSLDLLDPAAIVVTVTHDVTHSLPILSSGRRDRILSMEAGRLEELSAA